MGLGTITNTTNGGSSWNTNSNYNFYFKDVEVLTENNIITIGNREILGSSNGGAAWINQLSSTFDLSAVDFSDLNTGWVVGDSGNILKTTNGGYPVSVLEPWNYYSNSFQLMQNYPNPFNPITTINIEIPERSYVFFNVYDITGRLVRKLFSGEITTGSYKYRLDVSGLNSGVYFYSLTSAKFSKTKKLVVLK